MGIQEIRETTESCKHCFMCRHACPTFLTTKLDSHTPRGYALLLSEIDHGYQSWTTTIIDRFYQCSMCGLCREDCAYHWAEDEVVRNAREQIVADGRAPERVKTIADSVVAHHTPYGAAASSWVPAACTPDRRGAEVLYFGGCAVRHLHPEIGGAVEKVMNALAADWTVLRDEGCCGVPLFELGYTKEAAAAARQLAARVGELRPRLLVTGCAHCYRAFGELYPAWGAALPKDLQVMHISQYLARQFRQGALKAGAGVHRAHVFYHDPCQLGRKMHQYDAPRELIERITGSAPRELFHTREKAECCGAGSIMVMTDPELAARVANRRGEALREVDSPTLITACQNCKTVFTSALQEGGSGIQVLDIAEIAAMAL
jgi:heterodisulfide reductase subunit D